MKVEKIFGSKFVVVLNNEEELKAFETLGSEELVCGIVPKGKITHITYGLHEEEAIHTFLARRKKLQNRKKVKVEDLANLMMTNVF